MGSVCARVPGEACCSQSWMSHHPSVEEKEGHTCVPLPHRTLFVKQTQCLTPCLPVGGSLSWLSPVSKAGACPGSQLSFTVPSLTMEAARLYVWITY